jgi:hypothetical protein
MFILFEFLWNMTIYLLESLFPHIKYRENIFRKLHVHITVYKSVFHQVIGNLSQVARVAQWLERRCKDLVILASPVRIPLWEVPVLRMRPYREPLRPNAMSA